jgi:capsular exopolysaccharide synthesis family protein
MAEKTFNKTIHTGSTSSHDGENLSFAAREAFKRLRTNVLMAFQDEEKSCKVVGVTSAQPSEGKSTVSFNLAYSLAELGEKVILIDADMRRPSIHIKSRLNRAPGLSTVLDSSVALADVIQRYDSSKDFGFDVIAGGETIDNPSELLDSKRMKNLVRVLATAYDYIVIDAPPIGAAIDAVPVSKLADGMLVVIRENNCPKRALDDCINQLKMANARILGFVLNGALEGASKKYQYNNYYYA